MIDEILVENMFRNPEGNAVIFDSLLLEKAAGEEYFRLLLDTSALDVTRSGDRIESVRAFCGMNQTMYEVEAPLFCDASGDGALGFLGGAAFRIGAESGTEFDEGVAPSEEFGSLLGHSIFFYSKDVGRPVRFTPPAYAFDVSTLTVSPWRSFTASDYGCKLWWIEYGDRPDTIHDTEKIKWELRRSIYGLWDHIKNSDTLHDNYMLRQHDIVDRVEHPEAVAYGGWAIDLHPADGIFSEREAAAFLWAPSVNQIPSGACRNVPNLLLAGRLVSASHVAFGSTRVIGTGATMGQAVGMADALCAKSGEEPADLLDPRRMQALRRELQRSGQYIPGFAQQDPDDLSQQADLTASSEYVLDELPADGPLVALDRSRAQLLPLPPGRLPQFTFTVDVSAPTTLKTEVRTGDRADSFTPDVVLGTCDIDLLPGASQQVKVDIAGELTRSGYVFVCLMANEHVAVHASSRRLTGVLSLYHRDTQERDDDIGHPRAEFWPPERRPAGRNLAVAVQPALLPFAAANIRNGSARPTSRPNAWVAKYGDRRPRLTLRWPEPVRISRVDLSFETDSSFQWSLC